VSKSTDVGEISIETVVESRSRWGETIHRPDPESDEPQPACREKIAHGERGYREVALAKVVSHRELCGNPECFGGDWR